MNKNIKKIISLISLSSVFSLPVYASENHIIYISPDKNQKKSYSLFGDNFGKTPYISISSLIESEQGDEFSTPKKKYDPCEHYKKGLLTPKKQIQTSNPKKNLSGVFEVYANPNLKPFIDQKSGLITRETFYQNVNNLPTNKLETICSILEQTNDPEYKEYICNIKLILNKRQTDESIEFE